MKKFVFIEFFLIILLQQSLLVNGRFLFCGGIRSKYDSNTHDCEGGKIVSISTERSSKLKNLVCLENLKKYDNTTHKCRNGSVVLRSPSPQSITNTSALGSNLVSTNVSRIVCSEKHVLNCSGYVYESCSKQGTFECCGFRSYQPAHDSCCIDKVYQNKPQSKHICCNGFLYPRKHSDAPCQLASRNDWFFNQKPKRLQNRYIRPFTCDRAYAYHMRITGPYSDENGLYLTAIRITQYLWKTCTGTCRINERKVDTRIPLDRYTPTKLRRKSFLIWSNYKYLDDAFLFRRKGDVVFKAPRRRKKLFKNFRKILKFCLT